MSKLMKCALAASMALASMQPAQACWNNDAQEAATIAKLNMMLMVTGLRCRNGADNFLPQYNRFVISNNNVLGSQHAALKSYFAQTMGAKGAEGAFDRLVIDFANGYGAGHPTMGCPELKALATDLASHSNSIVTLLAVAERAVGKADVPGNACVIARLASK